MMSPLLGVGLVGPQLAPTLLILYHKVGEMGNARSASITVNVSMVSLKWGDVLSSLLPGALVIFALSQHVDLLGTQIRALENITLATGFALLIFSALAGGVLEAITRITWERWLVSWHTTEFDVLKRLTSDNIVLYERGVQSSYKWVTFYSNFAWAVLVLFVSLLIKFPVALWWSALLVAIFSILLRASYIQWTYFVNYQNKVFKPRSDNVEK